MPSSLASQLQRHCRQLAECRLCSHLDPTILPIVSAARSPRAMLVGQAPGQTEWLNQRPFSGRAGKTLFRWLEQAGFDEDRARDEIYIAAITRCYPGPSPSGRGDRVPTPSEQELCKRWLDAELAIIRPTLLIPVGRLAINRFIKPAPLDRIIGRTHKVEHAGGQSVAIPLPHPSGASSWIHMPGHKVLLDRAIALLQEHLTHNA